MLSGKNVRKVWEERGSGSSWMEGEGEGLPVYEREGGSGLEGGGERRGRVGVVMDEVGGGGDGESAEGLGVGQIM